MPSTLMSRTCLTFALLIEGDSWGAADKKAPADNRPIANLVVRVEFFIVTPEWDYRDALM